MLKSLSVAALFLLLVPNIRAEFKYIDMNLIPGLAPFILESPNYPGRSNPDEDVLWTFNTDAPARVSIHCPDFRFSPSDPCIVSYVIINKGQPDEVTLCGSQFDYKKISLSTKMTVTYYAGQWGGGSMKCVVQATTSDNVYHYQGADPAEVNSGEAGLINHPGRRTTSCPCGWVNKSPRRIFGGREAQPYEYPWLVGLVTGEQRRMPMCGGSIITKYHVLTAAHCVHEGKSGQLRSDTFSVIIGEKDLEVESEANQLIKVKQVIMYKNYSDYIKDFDIAILHLENKIQFSQLVGPVCLPNGLLDVRDQWLKVMGWGIVNSEGYSSTIPKVTYVKAMDINICNAMYLFQKRTEDSFHVCTWAKGTASCNGDSGGPLVWLDPETNRYTESALVSHALGCGSVIPSVNTDVSYFIEWIRTEVKKSEPKAEICTKV
uniref:Venom S1 protease with CUB domain 5 n=1 Tax=Ectomocoris sp. TaxID=3104572 RepID=A0AB38ZEB5_9HEMI